MNVLLISANTETINMPVLPLGMAFVARAAEDAGHKITQVNLMAEPEALKTLPDHIKMVRPNVIGISVRNIDDQNSLQTKFLLDPARAIVQQCRKHSDAKIVLGGAGYSIFPKSALSYLAADYGIQGEGEQSFAMLLNKLENYEDVSNIPGLYHSEGDIYNLPEAFKDIDQNRFPQPGKHIFSSPHSEDDITWLPIQTRRGCPLSCCYCSTPAIEGKISRKRSPGLVVEALASYIHAGFDHFYFVDNTFNLPPGYSKDLCDRMVESDLNIAWRGILYPGMLDEELVARMAKSGCVEVSLGMESGSDAILRRMNKHYRASDVRYASSLLKNGGIRQTGFLLLGAPGETRETVLESLEFADSLALDTVKVTIGLRIYPDTELAHYARKIGQISPEDNLLFPKFYIENGMEAWIRETAGAWMKNRPNWIH